MSHLANANPRESLADWMEEVAPFGIFTTDSELRIRTWNHWLAAQSGISKEAIVGRSLLEVFPDVASRRLDHHFRRALAGEVTVLSTALHRYLLPFPTPVRDAPGGRMLQTVRVAPFSIGAGEVGTVTLIEDVTQRQIQALALHRQQEKDRLLSAALAQLLQTEDPIPVVGELFPQIGALLKLEVYATYLLAPGGKELHLQSAAGISAERRSAAAVVPLGQQLAGLCASERRPIVRQNIAEAGDPASESVGPAGLRVYAGFPLLVGETLFGTLCFGSYVRDTIAPDEVEFLSTVTQYLAVAMDRARRVRALREAESRLNEHAQELEGKVAERTARLHETIAQLETFSYSVAHDLRAPIRVLKGYCNVLLADFGEEIPREAKDVLGRLARACARLDALTRDLLIFSRISRQDVELGSVNVGDLIRDIILLNPALQDDVLVVLPPVYAVRAQRTLLQQCLSNLFDNALKFVPAGTAPRIRVRFERRRPDEVEAAKTSPDAFNPPGARADAAAAFPAERIRIWVEDNGIGIHPDAHQKIFGIFERGAGIDHIEGTGIGLAIVARAVEQMGGRCGVESELGKGSRFWIDLAAAEVPRD